MKRLLAAALVIGCTATPPAFAGTWETSAFRTANGQLVRLGMTKDEVRRDAGAPLKGSAKSASGKRGEVWTYQGGDGLYALTFRSGRVAKIEVTPRRGN